MVDTITVMKNLINKKLEGRKIDFRRSSIQNIVLFTAHRLIKDGKLKSVYDSESEAKAAINKTLNAAELELSFQIEYKTETKYEELPQTAVKWANIISETEEIFHTKFDKKTIGLIKPRTVICECGNNCEYFAPNKGREVWFCPQCGASVGVHKGTNIPLGKPVSKETGKIRTEVHNEIERIIKAGMGRDHVYKLLSRKMHIGYEQTHVGMFTKEQCEKALGILKDINGKYNLL